MRTSILKLLDSIRLRPIVLFFTLTLFSLNSYATTYYSLTSAGSFQMSTISNWNTMANGSGTAMTNISELTSGAHSFVIQSPNIVTGDPALNCINLTIEEGAILDMNDKQLIVSGNVNLGGTLNLKNALHTIPSIDTYGTAKTGNLIVSGATWIGLQNITGNFLSTPTNTIIFQGSNYAIPNRTYPTLHIEGSGMTVMSGTTFLIEGDLDLKNGTAAFNVTSTATFSSNNSHNINVSGGSSLNFSNVTILGNTELTGYASVSNALTIISPSTFTNSSPFFEIVNTGTIAGTGNFVNKSSLNYNSSATITMAAANADFETYPNSVVYQQGSASPLMDTYDNIVFRNTRIIPAGILKANNLFIDNASGVVGGVVLSDGTAINIQTNLSCTNTTGAFIDFKTGNASITVNGSLNMGLPNTSIIQAPSSTSVQALVLLGASNTLTTYTTSGMGTCEVYYSGSTNQSMFASNNYKDLYLEGTAGQTKTVSGALHVSNKLSIKNSLLVIGDPNLTFAGPDAFLTWTNGWVATTGSGSLIRNTGGANLTFPVGNLTSFQPIKLTNTATGASVRYGSHTTALPFTGANSWYVNNGTKPTDIIFDKPIGYNLISDSKVGEFTSTWNVIPSTINFNFDEITAQNVVFLGQTKQLSLLNCNYNFNPPSSTLPEAFVGSLYSQDIVIPGYGRPNYTFSNISAYPSGLSAAIDVNTGYIKITGTPTTVETAFFTLDVKDGTGCASSSGIYSITVSAVAAITTTWDGTNWDNGIPTSTMDVILAGDYNTAIHGALVGNNITVKMGRTLTVSGTVNNVSASNNIVNDGIINQDCNASILAQAILNKPVSIIQPTITPATLPIAMIGVPYSVSHTVTLISTPTWTITGLPSGLTAINNIISGTATVAGSYTISIIAKEGSCTGIINPDLLVSTQVTTWNGTSWNNGIPTSSSDVILNGNYSTATNGTISSNNLSIATGVVFTITGTQTVSVLGNLSNSGTINQNCTASLIVSGTTTGNPPILIMPTLSPSNANFILGRVGDALSQQFSTNITPSNPLYSITIGTLPSGLIFSTDGKLSGTPTSIDAKIVEITYTDNACIVQSKYSILISDLPSPNMFVFPIQPKTYGDAAFYVQSHSPSTAAITYSITDANACVSIDATTGLVTILCAGPSPNNIVTVTATQTANTLYSGDIATQTFVISPKRTQLTVKKNAFIVGVNDVIPYTTNSTGTVGFLQHTGTSFASVSVNGDVQPTSEGAFTVQIKIPATANYSAFDSIFTFNVFIIPQAPVAVRDAVEIEMNQQITFNVLDNDYGITDSLITGSTDVDVRYAGLQINYYLTQLGSIDIDQSGNCTYIPFRGFIGTDSIGYTITDARGLTSDVAYISFTVRPPAVAPPMQSNQIITPNNDGSNDALVIANTNINEANSISISDEVGNIVFKQDNYRNNWTGLSNSGQILEQGIYYMVFIEKESGQSLYNYIQIVR